MSKSFAAVSIFAILIAAFAIPFVLVQSEPVSVVALQAS